MGTPEATHTTRRFGRYLTIEELGRGSYGVVYLARPAEGGDPVAIKVLLQGENDPGAVARFQQEAAIAARLAHPGLVRVLEAGWQSGHPWMAMEYCPGPTLSQRLRSEGPLVPADAAQLLAEVARAVAHAHDQSVVHRDLKPSNVILDQRTGRPRLTDFGLARDRALGKSMTATGEALGTPYYMSPEQVRAQRDLDARSDVWALGVILYECLTGRRPFEGRTSFLVAQQIIQHEPTPPSRLREGIAPALEAVCLRCLRKERSERYATAGALAFALEAAAGASLPSLVADGSLILPAPPARRGSRVAIGVAGALLAVGGGAAGALLGVRRGSPADAQAGAPETPAALDAQGRAERVRALLNDPTQATRPLEELLGRADQAAAAAGDDAALVAEVALWRADRLYRRGRTQQVASALEPVLGRGGRAGLEGRFLLGLALHDLGRDLAALREFGAVMRDDPQGALGLAAAARAECIREEGVGEEVLTRASALDPHGWQVQLTWAWSLMRRGLLDEARAILDRLIKERPDDFSVWSALAGLAARRGDEKAEAVARQRALEVGEKQPARWPLLERASERMARAISLGQPGEAGFDEAMRLARSDVDELLRRQPDDLRALMMETVLEVVAQQANGPSQQPVKLSALPQLEQACQQDPDRYARQAVSLGGDLGELLLNVGGWTAPAPALGTPGVQLRARLAARAQLAAAPARDALQEALELAAGGGAPSDVVAAVERARRLAPDDPQVRLEAARLLCGRDAPGALAAVDAALERAAPQARPELLRLRGEALLRRGKEAEALTAYAHAYEADPRGPEGLCAAACKLNLEMLDQYRRSEDEGRGGAAWQSRWALRAKVVKLASQALDGSPAHGPAHVLIAAMGERWSPRTTLARLELVSRREGYVDAQTLLVRACALWEPLVEQGQAESAHLEVQRAVDLSLGPWPRWRAGYRVLGRWHRRERERERERPDSDDPAFAEQLAREATLLDPQYGPALQLAGAARLRQGGTADEVLELWRRAHEVDPTPISRRWLDEFRERLGDDPLLELLSR